MDRSDALPKKRRSSLAAPTPSGNVDWKLRRRRRRRRWRRTLTTTRRPSPLMEHDSMRGLPDSQSVQKRMPWRGSRAMARGLSMLPAISVRRKLPLSLATSIWSRLLSTQYRFSPTQSTARPDSFVRYKVGRYKKKSTKQRERNTEGSQLELELEMDGQGE